MDIIKEYKEFKKEKLEAYEVLIRKDYKNNISESDHQIIDKYESACNKLNYTFELKHPYEGRVELPDGSSYWVTLPISTKIYLKYKSNEFHQEIYLGKIISGELKNCMITFDAFKAMNDGCSYY